MMNRAIRDFVVETNGQCFLCLNVVTTKWLPDPLEMESNPESYSSPKSYHSLHHLSSHLRLNKRKVFTEEESIPLKLLAKMDRSKLKVELCPRCNDLNQKFSKLYKKLEKIQMEMASCLRDINRKLQEADVDDRTNEFCNLTQTQPNAGCELGRKLEIAQALRNETIEKCSDVVKSSSPQLTIPVQRMTTEQVDLKQLQIKSKHRRMMHISRPILDRNSMNEASSDDPLNSHPHVELVHVKVEDSNSDPVTDDKQIASFDDDDNDNGDLNRDPLADLNSDSDDSSQLDTKVTVSWDDPEKINSLERERKKSNRKVTSENTSQFNEYSQRWTIIPQSGKYKMYKCKICNIELRKKGMYTHFSAHHLKKRITCKQCGKQFTQRSNYKRHYQCVHMRIRHICSRCNKSFSQKTALIRHHQNVACTMKKKSSKLVNGILLK